MLGLSVDRLAGDRRETEFYVLLLRRRSLGSVVLAGANDLARARRRLSCSSVPLYALVGFARDALGTEAALKTYLLAALAGSCLLAGVAVLAGVGGTTSYAALAPASAARRPAPSRWASSGARRACCSRRVACRCTSGCPTWCEGATTPAAAFLTTVPKVGALIAAFRFLAVVPTGPSTGRRWSPSSPR